MEDNIEDKIEDLVGALTTTKISDDILSRITSLLQELDIKLYIQFITENFQSLYTLEHWAWKILSKDSYQWLNHLHYLKLFESLALFNKNLIFMQDEMDANKKGSLLIPETTNTIDDILDQIEKINDENDPYYNIIGLWLNNLSYLINEHTQFIKSSVITKLTHTIASKFIMTDQYKFYLIQLKESPISQSIFTPKQLFYIQTCSFALSYYFYCKKQKFIFTSDEILHFMGKDYIEIIHIHSSNVQSWSKELLSCITNLINFIHTCCWWCGDKEKRVKILLPSEEILHDHIQSLMRIIAHKPFHTQIKIHQSNNETLLIDIILSFLLIISELEGLTCFLRSETNLAQVLLPLAETPGNNRINLCAYALLGELLCDQRLKQFKITDNLCGYFFYMLQHAWNHPAQKFQRSSVYELLRGFLNIAKNDSIQQATADSNRVSLFIEMCDEYPIVYEILWALSFNHDIQEQLRSNQKFMYSISHLKHEINNEQMRKITHGILWNLESNHSDRIEAKADDKTMFDIMISYSHKDKIICKQIYDELIKAGYRVWIDFDQIHGNVMDAMAQAIEQSKVVIICMSEDYRRSNYCRAEAYYAFQRQLKIIPVLVQKHYKPDSWLLFLVGQLLYIDFIKNEFPRAMEMLIEELKVSISDELKVSSFKEDKSVPLDCQHETNVIATNLPIPLPLPGSIVPVVSKNILEWNKNEVQDWLIGHNLVQMSRLLSDYDGASLVYLNKYLSNGEAQHIMKSLEEDSLRRTNQSLSLVELALLQRLIDQEQKQSIKSKHIKKKTPVKKSIHTHFCRTM